MHVPEIIEVKDTLEKMQEEGLIASWELPYENLLTRRSAAIFFLSLAKNSDEPKVWAELSHFEEFSYRANEEKKLSDLAYRITFNREEKVKNGGLTSEKVLL